VSPASGPRRRPWAGLRLRLFAFNCLLVVLPASGLLFLDAHERAMLASQERTMVGIGRVLAASLAGAPGLEPDRIRHTLHALEHGTEARLRVLDARGRVLGDSATLGPARADADPDAVDAARGGAEHWLYRAAAWPVRTWRRLRGGGAPPLESADPVAAAAAAGAPLAGREIEAALAGRYGAATRVSAGGQRSLTLYSALPVTSRDGVIGVVLVSQSTWRILQALHALRLEVAKILAGSLLAAGALSLLLARTIARPLRRLRDEAESLLDRSGRLRGRFTGTARHDEIGALARSLEALRARLDERVGAMERFAIELDHEFKNPLASVRSAAELLVESHDPTERRRLTSWIERDVARMQHILGGVREIGRRDAGREPTATERVDLGALLRGIAEGGRRHAGRVRVTSPSSGPWVEACPEELCQVFENLVDNAIGFAGGQPVDVEVVSRAGDVGVRVLDRGPGIRPHHLAKVFDRFFSHRPRSGTAAAGAHAGLGLAIARTIVEARGGHIRASNRPDGGACFEVVMREAGGGARHRPRASRAAA
jgi:two-component system sensor histidine kinase ChvG